MRLWSPTIALCVCAAAAAQADVTARRDTVMGATVSTVCRLGGVTITDGENATFSAGDQGGAITLSALADRNTARALPASISVTFQGVCNEPQSIRLVSSGGGLTQDQGAQSGGGFLNRVDYTATLGWGAGQTTLSTDGTAHGSATVLSIGARSGAVTLVISIPAGSQPLVAGNYSDVLTVEFADNL